MLNREPERTPLKLIVVHHFRPTELVMRDGAVFVRVLVIENVGYNSLVVFLPFLVMYRHAMCSSLCLHVRGHLFLGQLLVTVGVNV